MAVNINAVRGKAWILAMGRHTPLNHPFCCWTNPHLTGLPGNSLPSFYDALLLVQLHLLRWSPNDWGLIGIVNNLPLESLNRWCRGTLLGS